MNSQYKYIRSRVLERGFDFDELCLEVYEYQKKYNLVYARFLALLGRDKDHVVSYQDIPFLPISLFKNLDIKTGDWSEEGMFKSSGTMGLRSQHLIRSLHWYKRNSVMIFEDHFKSKISDYEICALLPNYQSNPHSSLITMVDHFMNLSGQDRKLYFDQDSTELRDYLTANHKHKKMVLFGVSFALVQFCDNNDPIDTEVIIIETGGMKKFDKEMTKEEIFGKIRNTFPNAVICSEYGMTECLSQAYSYDSFYLSTNSRFKVVISDPNDYRMVLPEGRVGRINIVDLANLDTISFIATDDLGKFHTHDLFSVLGRLDNSDLRGCNYLF